MITSVTVMLVLLNLGHMTTFTNDLSHVIKIVLVASWTEILTSQPLDENGFILRGPTAANFADIIKPLLKKPLKTQKRLIELEIMCSNAIFICISWYSKIC